MSVDSRYIRVATKFWQDEKVKALSDDSKLLYLYVLTSPHSNMAGYYVLPKPYVAYDLNWLPERLDKAFDKLLHHGLIKYCKQSDVVLIPNFLRYNPMQNKNQAIGAARRVSELPSNTLTKDFLTVLKRFAEPFLEHFAEWFANTDTESDTDTDTESGAEAQAPTEKEPDDDDEKFNSEIVKEFAVAYGYPPNQTQLEMLTTFLDDGFPEELIIEALKRSAESGAKTPKYTTAILQSWMSKKAFTLQDVKRLDGTAGKTRATQVFGDSYEYNKREPAAKGFFAFLDDEVG